MPSFLRSLTAASALTLGLIGAVQAQNYSFSCVSNNSATNCATGLNQLSMTLTQGVGSVEFRFSNTGLLASSITDIYWDWADGEPLFDASVGTITSSSGVSFNWGASPSNLPSGQNLSPSFSADLGADSNAPTQPNGVNPGEWVSFRFLTGVTSTAADLLNGDLRIGLHVQGFSNGGSESFVNGGTTPIASPAPEPETYAMMLAGLAIVGGIARRRKQQG
ncbi:MAG: PEP-CTERM sorting domain-containing protein [Piscinibacter sp.]